MGGAIERLERGQGRRIMRISDRIHHADELPDIPDVNFTMEDLDRIL